MGLVKLDTIVGKLLEVDKEAHRILDDAKQYEERIFAETEGAKGQLLQKYNEKAQRHIREAREANEADAGEEIATIRQRYGQLARAMEEAYEHDRQQWQEELLERCIGR